MRYKLIIIINGKGGVGKDTLCGFAGEAYDVINLSSITPIKKIAASFGWNGEKDEKSRKFLADLKKAFTEYNDLPNNYILDELKKFISSSSQIAFIHIREKEQIEKSLKRIKNLSYENTKIAAATILVEGRIDDKFALNGFGNDADDNVNIFDYDYVFDNTVSLIEAKPSFQRLIKDIINKENLCIHSKN